MPDLASLAAAFTARLRAEGVPAGPDRGARFAAAVTVLNPETTAELRHCALATLVSDPDQLPTFDAVFAAVFGGLVDPAGQRGQDPRVGPAGTRPNAGHPEAGGPPPRGPAADREAQVDVLASAAERFTNPTRCSATACCRSGGR